LTEVIDLFKNTSLGEHKRLLKTLQNLPNPQLLKSVDLENSVELGDEISTL